MKSTALDIKEKNTSKTKKSPIRTIAIMAFLIGIIGVLPQIILQRELGAEYSGIHYHEMSDELTYLSRIQEVVDGHKLIGSTPYYEYKDSLPFLPPVTENLYAIASQLTRLSPTQIVIASKFILPALLFILLYILFHMLIDKQVKSRHFASLAGAALITLAYDLIDYRSAIDFVVNNEPLGLLLWTRPVTPILGMLAIVTFLIIIKSLERKITIRGVVIAAAALALMIVTYYYSWTLMLAFTGLLTLKALIDKKYKRMFYLITVVGVAGIVASPYFYMIASAWQDPAFADSSLRTGLMYLEYPIINKFLVLGLITFIIITFPRITKSITEKRHLPSWWWFSISLLLAGFIAFNQHLIIGRTVWPYHYVQYTVPLTVVVLITTIANTIGLRHYKVMTTLYAIVIIIAAVFGISSQSSSVYATIPKYSQQQNFALVRDWLNTSASKDCVVLPLDQKSETQQLILAYTHCNVYSSSYNSYLLPTERLIHNFLITMKIDGVKPDNVQQYIEDHERFFKGYFGAISDWKNITDSPELHSIEANLIQLYPAYHRQKIDTLLEQYQFDYILADKPLAEWEQQELFTELQLVADLNSHSYIYSF